MRVESSLAGEAGLRRSWGILERGRWFPVLEANFAPSSCRNHHRLLGKTTIHLKSQSDSLVRRTSPLVAASGNGSASPWRRSGFMNGPQSDLGLRGGGVLRHWLRWQRRCHRAFCSLGAGPIARVPRVGVKATKNASSRVNETAATCGVLTPRRPVGRFAATIAPSSATTPIIARRSPAMEATSIVTASPIARGNAELTATTLPATYPRGTSPSDRTARWHARAWRSAA